MTDTTPTAGDQVPAADAAAPAADAPKVDPTTPGGPVGTKEQNDQAKAEVKAEARADHVGNAPAAPADNGLSAQEQTHINALPSVVTSEDILGVERISPITNDANWKPAPVEGDPKERERLARVQAALDAKLEERRQLLSQ